jgi:hypothetical protein
MASRKYSRLHRVLLIGLFVASAAVYSALIEDQPTGWDALGYKIAGHHIAVGLGPAIEQPLNEKYGPYFTLSAFAVQSLTQPARLYLNYPPGFPFLLAIPQWLGLPDSLTLLVISLLSLAFTYWLGVLLFDRWVGLLAATIVAITSAHLEWGTSMWSDLSGTVFMLGAFAAYISGARQERRAGWMLWGALAGTLVVMAIFIKYANVLVVLPMIAYALYTQRRAAWKLRLNWVCGTVILAGLLGVGAYNQVVYGHPLETFYSPVRSGLSFPFFSLSYALGDSPVGGRSFIAALGTLWDNFSWLLLLGVLGVFKAPRKVALLLGGQSLVFLFLASLFAWAPQGVDTRYLLPLFTPLALFIAWETRLLAEQLWPRKGLTVLFLAAIGITLALGAFNTVPRLTARNQGGRAAAQLTSDWTADSESDAIFLAYNSNDLISYFGRRTTLFYRRMRLVQPDFESNLTHLVENLLAEQLPVYYVEDLQPSLAHSKDILQRHFDLQLWKSEPFPIFRVRLKAPALRA